MNYTPNDLKELFDKMDTIEIQEMMDIIGVEMSNLLYHYPDMFAEILYSNMSERAQKMFHDMIPDMEPPTDKEVLDTIDKIMYYSEDDRYLDAVKTKRKLVEQFE